MASRQRSIKQKIIAVVGPTASGKSELAVRLAQKFNGEIISADSRQIYRGLDIGSGKVPGKWVASRQARSIKYIVRAEPRIYLYKNIPHHCIDFAHPKRVFTAAEYKKCAVQAIGDIAKRGKMPILAGGTGFWIDTVAYDLNIPGVPPNQQLRKQLGEKRAEELLKILMKLDPRRSKNIEQKNPRRLIRAIEIAQTLGWVPKLTKRSPYDTLWLGLSPSAENGSPKIRRRTEEMIRRGLIRETKNLLRRGAGRKRIGEFGFEYRLALECADGRISKKELQEKLWRETLQYARRQMRWWRRNHDIHWISSPLHLNGTNIKRTLDRFLASRSHVSKS